MDGVSDASVERTFVAIGLASKKNELSPQFVMWRRLGEAYGRETIYL